MYMGKNKNIDQSSLHTVLKYIYVYKLRNNITDFLEYRKTDFFKKKNTYNILY